MEPTTVGRSSGSSKARADARQFALPPRRMSGPLDAAGSAERLVSRLVSDHAVSMLATARRYSLCVDDAHEAWQRSIEILMRRAQSLDPATAAGWLRTVVKHEAMAVRSERTRFLGRSEFEPDAECGGDDPVARSERLERLRVAAEALQRLKPNEAEALMLLASGLSYKEISAEKGWTYTKVNRLITEGRQAFRQGTAEIDAGEACTRWSGVLTRIADGEATASELADVTPHLQRCPACRAALNADRESRRALSLLIPGVGAAEGLHRESNIGHLSAACRWLSDVILSFGVRVQGAVETVSAGKVAAVAASSVAIAGGGVAARHEIEHRLAPVQPAAAAAAERRAPSGTRPGASPLTAVTGGGAERAVRQVSAGGPEAGGSPPAADSPGPSQPEEFDPVPAEPGGVARRTGPLKQGTPGQGATPAATRERASDRRPVAPLAAARGAKPRPSVPQEFGP